MTVTRKWSLLAAVLAVAIFAAGWFLLVGPKRSEAASLRSETESQQQANSALVQKLAELKAQQAELPEQRARLAVFRTQIPDNPALPSLIRDLTAAGRSVGASVDEMTPGTPVVVVDTAAPIVAAVPEATTDPEAAADPAAAPVEPVVAAPSALLYSVPLNMKISGSYFELEQFVNKLEGLKRSFLVAGFTVTPTVSTVAPEGTLTLDLQGKVFLAPEAAEALATTLEPTPVPATSE